MSEFLEMVRRNFGADGARVTPVGQAPPATDNILLCELPAGQTLVVSFSGPIPEKESIRRRLEMLVHAFGSLLANAEELAPASAQRREQILHQELGELAKRALAVDA